MLMPNVVGSERRVRFVTEEFFVFGRGWPPAMEAAKLRSAAAKESENGR